MKIKFLAKKAATWLEAHQTQIKQALPALAFLAVGILSASPAHAATTTTIGNSINSGFKAIYDIGKIAIGGVALVMSLWHIFRWFGGDQEAPKRLAVVGVIGIIALNLDSILKLFGLTI